MSKTIVFYKSKYSNSKEFAYWISNTLKCDIFDYSDITVDKLLKYDTIIYGSNFYSNQMDGVSLITKNFEKLKNKKIIIYTVGLSSSNNPDFFIPQLNLLFSKEMRNIIIFFHFPSTISNPSFGYLYTLILKTFKSIATTDSLDNLSLSEKLFLKAYDHKIDFSDINTLNKLSYYTNINV